MSTCASNPHKRVSVGLAAVQCPYFVMQVCGAAEQINIIICCFKLGQRRRRQIWYLYYHKLILHQYCEHLKLRKPAHPNLTRQHDKPDNANPASGHQWVLRSRQEVESQMSRGRTTPVVSPSAPVFECPPPQGLLRLLVSSRLLFTCCHKRPLVTRARLERPGALRALTLHSFR